MDSHLIYSIKMKGSDMRQVEQIEQYKHILESTQIQETYAYLIKFLGKVKVSMSKKTHYKMGNISHGYLDYTYFSFTDEGLRDRKLRFGLVLNHKKMCFELWLMGQNIETQGEYWSKLRQYGTNRHRHEMPKYSIYEIVLVTDPDFGRSDALIQLIVSEATKEANQIKVDIL